MGQKLLSYYDEAKKIGGFKAQMRLALLTSIGGQKAGKEPDSPENIKKFEKGMQEIRKEFK